MKTDWALFASEKAIQQWDMHITKIYRLDSQSNIKKYSHIQNFATNLSDDTNFNKHKISRSL